MKYVFTFNEINYGRIEIESNHKPDNGEIIEKILEGKADYNETNFTDFKLIEADGELHNDGNYPCCLHETPRTLDWCEQNCDRYYRCDTVALAADELNDDKTDDGLLTFEVTITETLQKTVTVTAKDPCEAEETVQSEWDNQDHVLDADHFKGVRFTAVPIRPECP